MYELIHEDNKWNLYVDGVLFKECKTLEEGVKEIERLKGEN